MEQVTRGCVVDQKGQTTAFYRSDSIDDNYTDGLLITYASPHQNISGGFDDHTDIERGLFNCPCVGGWNASPSL